MSVIIETTIGDITVDLFVERRPQACKNFLKLCKIKYYNLCLFHSVQTDFLAQTGDPTGSGDGGESIFGVLHGEKARYFEAEMIPKMKHNKPGLLSMVNCGKNMIGSQFFMTLGSDLQSLDEHCIFAEVVDGLDVLLKLNEAICDVQHRPYKDIRITHTVVLEDPFEDPDGIVVPDRSPDPSQIVLTSGRIGADENIEDAAGMTAAELEEMKQDREAKARATILEIVGDLPDADMAPPENVLFVCKLNPITTDDDLEIIFNRFGKVKSCEVIRDQTTGDSLQYAFIEFDDQRSCEEAYFKMDNVTIDDRRIHVDFSQSVAKMRWRGKGRGVDHLEKHQDEAEHKNKRDSSHRDSSHKNSSHRDSSNKDSSHKDSSHKDSSHKDSSHKDSSHKDSSHKDSSHKDSFHRDSSHVRSYFSYRRHDPHRGGCNKDPYFKGQERSRGRDVWNRDWMSESKRKYEEPRRRDDSSGKKSYDSGDKRGEKRSQDTRREKEKEEVVRKDGREKNKVERKKEEDKIGDLKKEKKDKKKSSSDTKNEKEIPEEQNEKEDNKESDINRLDTKLEDLTSDSGRGSRERGEDSRVGSRERGEGNRVGSRERGEESKVDSDQKEEKVTQDIKIVNEKMEDGVMSKVDILHEMRENCPIEGSENNVIKYAKPSISHSKKRKLPNDVKKKKKKRKLSSSESSSSASSSDSSESSSSESLSNGRKKKLKLSVTVAKKYYHKGKLVKIVKKKGTHSSDSESSSEESSDSSSRSRRRRKAKKKYRQKVVKVIKRKVRNSSDESDSESLSSSSDDIRKTRKKKRKIPGKRNRKNRKSNYSNRKVNKKKQTETTDSSGSELSSKKINGSKKIIKKEQGLSDK